MNTVITPEALRKSKFKKCKLSEMKDTDGDEFFLFLFPSASMTNRANGDGDLLEIHDYRLDLTEIYTGRGTHKATPDTEIYYR